MQVEHIVLFKLKQDAGEAQKQRMHAELKALQQKIDGIEFLTVGENFSSRNQGFQVGLVVRFRNRAALEAYLPHPAHRDCVDQYIRPIMEDVIVVDYEIG